MHDVVIEKKKKQGYRALLKFGSVAGGRTVEMAGVSDGS